MSMTAYEVQAHGHDRNGDDYGYVNIMYRYGGKMPCPRPDQCEKMEVMWADESVYGPPAPGCKVGDTVEFGGLLGSAPVMPCHTGSAEEFVARGGRIPAPMHSLKN